MKTDEQEHGEDIEIRPEAPNINLSVSLSTYFGVVFAGMVLSWVMQKHPQEFLAGIFLLPLFPIGLTWLFTGGLENQILTVMAYGSYLILFCCFVAMRERRHFEILLGILVITVLCNMIGCDMALNNVGSIR